MFIIQATGRIVAEHSTCNPEREGLVQAVLSAGERKWIKGCNYDCKLCNRKCKYVFGDHKIL
jgi:hypothetical protein